MCPVSSDRVPLRLLAKVARQFDATESAAPLPRRHWLGQSYLPASPLLLAPGTEPRPGQRTSPAASPTTVSCIVANRPGPLPVLCGRRFCVWPRILHPHEPRVRNTRPYRRPWHLPVLE